MPDRKYSDATIAAVAMQSKNVMLGLILAFFFGSIGLLYTSCLLGVIGIIMEVLIWFIALVTLGFGAFLIVPWHIFSMILVVILINSHNKRLLSSLR